jgi:hypothetical protein
MVHAVKTGACSQNNKEDNIKQNVKS